MFSGQAACWFNEPPTMNYLVNLQEIKYLNK